MREVGLLENVLSRTVTILSCSGVKAHATFSIGWGSVIEVGELPSQFMPSKKSHSIRCASWLY